MTYKSKEAKRPGEPCESRSGIGYVMHIEPVQFEVAMVVGSGSERGVVPSVSSIVTTSHAGCGIVKPEALKISGFPFEVVGSFHARDKEVSDKLIQAEGFTENKGVVCSVGVSGVPIPVDDSSANRSAVGFPELDVEFVGDKPNCWFRELDEKVVSSEDVRQPRCKRGVSVIDFDSGSFAGVDHDRLGFVVSGQSSSYESRHCKRQDSIFQHNASICRQFLQVGNIVNQSKEKE